MCKFSSHYANYNMKKITCKNCGVSFFARTIVDNKPRNLYKRKYCFSCSPFKSHNTKTLEKVQSGKKMCPSCGNQKSLSAFYHRGGKRSNEITSYCKKCTNYNSKERQQKVGSRRRIEAILQFGGKCVRCGYNKNTSAINFHHKDCATKKFSLDKRAFANYSNKVIQEELKKCIMLCSNCHVEIHNPNSSRWRQSESN